MLLVNMNSQLYPSSIDDILEIQFIEITNAHLQYWRDSEYDLEGNELLNEKEQMTHKGKIAYRKKRSGTDKIYQVIF